MCQYGKAAVKAVEFRNDGERLQSAWEKAISEYTTSELSRDKGCPRNAFLGLCEEGMIKGVDPGDYGAGEKSKGFAIRAVQILREEPTLSLNMTKLWKKVMENLGEDTSKSQASRMGVVTALWPKWIKNGGNR